MSITIESFTLEDDSTIATAINITNLFVEYSFLNFEYGELETPSSQPKPQPGEPAIYNFKKGEHIKVCYKIFFLKSAVYIAEKYTLYIILCNLEVSYTL